MYKAFFGFSERPFKLVPDPAYFFLGPSHEEALAHLEFAVRQGEGFTLITGEVGTGKTTLCRRFLENLDKNTEVAYIFNPVLGVLELLKSINEEYGISSAADFPRDLINQLNAFLLEMKAKNRRVILLIDEAQNLTAEVLEQLRLLSNLETTRSKLLQIILVGQPELNELLSSYKLRQLGQRISLSCRLLPLTRPETQRYIVHRISIVSNRPEAIFSTAAMGEIHTFSGGIPRLINTACDRSLLVAFSQNEGHVSGQSARLAVKELRNYQNRRPIRDRFRNPFRNPARFLWIWILLGIGCLALIGFWFVPKMQAVDRSPEPATSELARQLVKPVTAVPPIRKQIPQTPNIVISDLPDDRVPAPVSIPPDPSTSDSGTPDPDIPDPDTLDPDPPPALDTSEPEPFPDRLKGGITLKGMNIVQPRDRLSLSPPVESSVVAQEAETGAGALVDSVTADGLMQFVGRMDPEKSRRNALFTVLGLWAPGLIMQPGPGEIKGDLNYFRQIAGDHGLGVHRTGNDLSLIAGMDLPAILAFDSDGTTRYLALNKWDNQTLFLTDGNRRMSIPGPDLLKSGWKWAYIPWKDFAGISGTIPRDASSETILTFKLLLRKMGFSDVPLTADYGTLTRGVVEQIQNRGGIPVDGLVGPATKIIIYNNLEQYIAPRIGATAKTLG